MKARKSAQWSRLDNAAKIFPPTSTKADPKVFRFSCELTEAVEPETLQQALDRTVEAFPHFRSILRRGLFWYYLEGCDLRARVRPECDPPCVPLYDPVQKNLLFTVHYYRRRINCEIYHALTDGTGALQFLRVLVYQYLILRHADAFPDGPPLLDYDASLGEKKADSFRKYYSDSAAKKREHAPPRAYRLSGARLRGSRIRVIEGELSAAALVALARTHGATVTAFLAAAMLLAVYEGMPVRERGKPVVISIPVNLRKYFQSESARNFFGVVKVRYTFPDEGAALETVIGAVTEGLNRELTTERLSERMNALSALEHNMLARLIPLFIKDISLRIAGRIARREETCSLSNIGRVDMPPELDPYIRLIDAFNSADALKGCLCSYGDRMLITLTSPFVDTDVQKRFFRTLTEQGLSLVIRSNQPEDPDE